MRSQKRKETSQSPERHPIEPALFLANDVAQLLKVSRAQFYRKHKAGLVPLPLRLGGSVRWRVKELHAWIEAGMPSRKIWQAMKGGAV